MGPRHGSFRSRAASLIRSPLATIHQGQYHDASRDRHSSNASHTQTFNEKQDGLDRRPSASSGGHTGSENTTEVNRESERRVRSIPVWVHTWEEVGASTPSASSHFSPPTGAHVAQHNSAPYTKSGGGGLDTYHQAQDEEQLPLYSGDTDTVAVSRWKAFKEATAYPRINPSGGRIVTQEWLQENGPDYYQPWMAGQEEGDGEGGYKSRIKQRSWYLRLERTILRSPIVPMVVRMIVMSFSVVALGLAASIHHITNKKGNVVGQTPSTDMAIIVDAVAVVYLFYTAYDEYAGKPLGLRSARAKMRLIFLDLFFIVFDSANLSLAFVSTRDTTCNNHTNVMCGPEQYTFFNEVLRRQRALAGVLLIALIAWLLTFSISITRLVEKMTSR